MPERLVERGHLPRDRFDHRAIGVFRRIHHAAFQWVDDIGFNGGILHSSKSLNEGRCRPYRRCPVFSSNRCTCSFATLTRRISPANMGGRPRNTQRTGSAAIYPYTKSSAPVGSSTSTATWRGPSGSISYASGLIPTITSCVSFEPSMTGRYLSSRRRTARSVPFRTSLPLRKL